MAKQKASPIVWTSKESKAYLRNYRNYVSSEVHNTILDFHAHTVLALPARIPTYFVDPRLENVIRETVSEEELLEPHFKQCVNLPLIDFKKLERLCKLRISSAANFSSKRKISDNHLLKILAGSFCELDRDRLHRPYPSAGGLFPVSVFVYKFPNRYNSLEAGCYYLLPKSRKLQKRALVVEPQMERRFYDSHHMNQPTASIIYVLNIERAIFKYSFRGYRHGLIEVGSMVQALHTIGSAFGATTRCYSGQFDHWFNKYLDLSSQTFLPLLIQQIGVQSE